MTVISDKKIYLSELVSAATVVVLGIFLLLAGLNAFPFSIDRCWLPATLAALALICMSSAIIQKNVICTFFALFLGLIALAQILVAFGYAYRNIYPLYVLALPVATAGISFKTNYVKKILFGSLAVVGGGSILFFESTMLLSVKIVLPIEAIYFGLLGVICALIRLKKNKQKENI